MGYRTITIMGLSGLVLVVLCVIVVGLPSAMGACRVSRYTIFTLTGTRKDAATDDWVDVKVLFENGQSDWHTMDHMGNDFEPGVQNHFRLHLCPQGKINGFMLRVNNYFAAIYRSTPNWYLVWAAVAMGGGGIVMEPEYPLGPLTKCYFNEWVSSKDYSVCIKDNIEVQTRRLKELGFFKGERRIKGIRRHGELPRDCHYWKDGRVVMEKENQEICRNKP